MNLTHLNLRNSELAHMRINYEPLDVSKINDLNDGLLVELNRVTGFTHLVGNPNAVQEDRDIANFGDATGSTIWNFIANKEPFSFVNPVEAFGIDQDPIIGLQKLGNTLIMFSEGMYSIDLLSDFVPIKKASSIAGKSKNFFGELGHVKKRAESLGGAFSFIMIALFVCGVVLLYYVPLVPFIVWISAITGYLVIVVESLLAATLWFAAHVMPSGDGLVSDAGRRGYFFALNVAVRPPIMVFALIFGAALMHIMVSYTSTAYLSYIVGLMADRTDFTGLLTFACLMLLLMAIIVMIVHSTHALVSATPEHVIRYVSGESRPGGEMEQEGKANAIFTRSTHTLEGAMNRPTSPVKGSKGGSQPLTQASRSGSRNEG